MNSVPLTDVLPWGDSIPNGGRTILICDSTETDGRFLLHTLASQCINASSSTSASTSASISASKSMSGSSSFRRNTNIANTKRNKNMNQNNNGQVLWIHCGCFTDNQLRLGLKKAGCDASSIASSPSSSSFAMNRHTRTGTTTNTSSQLEIINIMNELSEYYHYDNTNTDNDIDADASNNEKDDKDYQKEFIKGIYLKAKEWVNKITQPNDNDPNNMSSSQLQSQPNPLIILDNASQLSNQFNPQLTHALIQKLQNLLTKKSIGCFTILCSNDFDQEYYLNSSSSSQHQHQSKVSVKGGSGKMMQYIGGGGRGILIDSEEMSILNSQSLYELQCIWERSLVEIADGIIDVMPLPSGFARDVHGRLVFTEWLGSKGWRDGRNDNNSRSRNGGGGGIGAGRVIATSAGMLSQNNFSTTTVNFCCHDSGVRAIRLRV